jgi:hypothetical protein
VAYQVQEDGNWDPVPFKKEKMKAKEVFILVNEEKREIWIWVGEKADVKTRFISSTAAQEIRRIYGLTFRIHAADQGKEPIEFREAIVDTVPNEGIGPSDKKAPTKRKPSKRAPAAKKTTTRSRKRPTTKKKSSNVQHPRPLLTEVPKFPSDQIKDSSHGQPSLITTPECPVGNKGHLLPYSIIVNVTARKKDILPFGKWICSNCRHSLDSEG